MPSCPAFHIKGSALCVGFIQLSPISAQSHLRDWDDLNAVCETSLYLGWSVPRRPGHWSLNLGSCICTWWICTDVFPCNSFHPLLRWARGTAGLTDCPCLASSGVWSCGVEGDVQSSVAKLDGAGLYKPRDPVRNISLVCTLCHKPSLAQASCHSVCPFKHSLQSVSQWDTSSSRDFHAVKKGVTSFCYCGSERFFQHFAADSLLPFQHAVFYHWAPPEAQPAWHGANLWPQWY